MFASIHDRLCCLARTLGKVVVDVSGFFAALALKADIDSPTFTGPVTVTGTLRSDPDDLSDPRFSIITRTPTVNGFNAFVLKTAGGSTDGNVEGGVVVHHDIGYVSTSGYAGVTQFYTLAGGEGAVFGCNSYTGMSFPPYAPGPTEEANGFLRFELGPLWPRSEVARFQNDGEFLVGKIQYAVGNASQTGDIVTSPDVNFVPNCLGEYVGWGTGGGPAGGKIAQVDQIIEWISTSQVRVKRSRTVASQPVRLMGFASTLSPLGELRLTGYNARIVRDAWDGADRGRHPVPYFSMKALTGGGNPAAVTMFSPDEFTNTHSAWEVCVVGFHENGTDVARFRRTFDTNYFNGVNSIANMETIGTDSVTGTWTIAITWAAGQLRILCTGDAVGLSVWTADCRQVCATIAQ